MQKFFFKNFNSYYCTDYIYDLCAKKYVEKCDVFHYWRDHGELSAKKAKKLGAKIFVENASLHPITHTKIIKEEYKKLGIKIKLYSKKHFRKQLEQLKNADYVVVPGGGAYNSFIKEGFKKEKLVKVNFGVPEHIFNGKFNKKDRKDNKFRAIYVGQVSVAKGIHYLLKAWDELRLKNSELLIIGKPTEETKPLLNQYMNREDIKFLGHQNPFPYYKKSDVFVFPTLSEGSALVTYEALGLGLPQIVTENSGSVIRNGKEGFIIPIKDINSLKRKIKYLYGHPRERERMAKNSIKLAKKYPWENYGKTLIKAYRKALIGKNKKISKI
ncbi:hypothetical protein A3K62_01215 [Candidatus Pacearchaeota archaeon RBG_16_35_8]|nr:MAG: hypothetical protein A3K62_01215 [Candidatus Pacearchaeota archaeon RBG_16_35_8]